MKKNRYNSDCIFCKIASGELGKNTDNAPTIPYEDDDCIVFETINPEAKTHLLIVPKNHIEGVSNLKSSDELSAGHLLRVSAILSEKFNLPDYKIEINNGAGAGQTVFHLHVHFLSDKSYK